VPSIAIFGKVYEMQPSGPNAAVHEADVCFVTEGADDICASTLDHPDNQNYDKGVYELVGVPMSTVGAVRFSGPTLSTFYYMVATESEDMDLTMSIDRPATIESYYDQTGIVRDTGGFVVLGEIFPDIKSDYEAVLTPASGEGPFYYGSPKGLLDLAATATKANIAMGVFLNVDLGDGPFMTSFTNGGPSCTTPSFGGAAPAWSIPADADIVYMAFECP